MMLNNTDALAAADSQIRLTRLARMLERVNRVLVRSDNLRVQVAQNGAAPAWSDGKDVTFNAASINDSDLKSLVGIYGLNYHEMAHLLYTPRRGSKLALWVIDNGYWSAFNALEDQRIETLLVGRFPAVKQYLTATILRWLADDAQKLSANYPLVRGRKYLPVAVRQAFRDAFSNPEHIDAINTIVDEYRLLVFPRDYDRAKSLIAAFARIMRSCQQQPTKGECGHLSAGSPAPQGEQERDRDNRQDGKDDQPTQPKAQPQQPADEDEDGEGAGNSESDDDTDSDGESTDGAGDSDGDDTDSDSDDAGSADGDDTDSDGGTDGNGDADAPSDSESTDGAATDGNGNCESEGNSEVNSESADGVSTNGSFDDLTKAIEDAIRDAIEDSTVQQDMESASKTLNSGDGKHQSTLQPYSTPYYAQGMAANTVSDEGKGALRRFQSEARRLMETCEAGWERETDSGVLNVNRWVDGATTDEMYDQWNEGGDGADLEVVILLDNSGSMRGQMQVASESTWVLTRGLKEVGASVTTIAFNSESYLVYSADDTARQYKEIHADGGTHATDALTEAHLILNESVRANKMVLIITDGQWSGYSNEQDNAFIANWRAAGVLTALGYIGGNANKLDDPAYTHGAEIRATLNTSADLLPFGKSVINTAVKRRAAR